MTAVPAATRLTSVDFVNVDTSGLYLDNGLIWSDGAGNLTAQTLQTNQATGVVQTLATGNTITIAGLGVARVTAAAAVTGIQLPVGTRPGQQLVVIHEGAAANTITFAAANANNTGGPADGTSDVMTGPSCRLFVWDSITGLWYKAA